MSLLVRSEVDAGEIDPTRSSTRGRRTSDDKLNAKMESLLVSSGEKDEVGFHFMSDRPSQVTHLDCLVRLVFLGAALGRCGCSPRLLSCEGYLVNIT